MTNYDEILARIPTREVAELWELVKFMEGIQELSTEQICELGDWILEGENINGLKQFFDVHESCSETRIMQHQKTKDGMKTRIRERLETIREFIKDINTNHIEVINTLERNPIFDATCRLLAGITDQCCTLQSRFVTDNLELIAKHYEIEWE